MRKLLHIISCISLVIVFIFILLIGFWLNYPYKPVQFYTLKIVPNTVHAGDSVHFELTYCKYMKLPAKVETHYKDSLIYSGPEISTNNLPGCRTDSVLIQVPVGLPPETYVIQKVYKYQVNPIREIRITVISEPFKIIK